MAQDYSSTNLYRLPWNLADNAISWLEPTSMCNLYCDGCYRENRSDSHKPLSEVALELDVFAAKRHSDCISIAGGEPLTHPEIVEIVKMIKKRGWKPILNSNGALLTPELLHNLKKAGLFGFTFHVDSGQGRKGWQGKTEIELNDLRYQIARMVADEGGLSCSFNMTVYPENMQHIPALLKWSQENMDIVHTMVFIIYRMAVMGHGFDWYAHGEKVDFSDMMYSTKDESRRTDVKAQEVVELIRSEYPDFMPSAFLNGTKDINSFKWLLTGRVGNKREIFGYMGPKSMEFVQVMKHIFTGRYLSYATPAMQRGFLKLGVMGLFDKSVRRAAGKYLSSLFTNPKAFFSGFKYQTVMIIQPVDILANGDQNMCDGCPDITVWNGELVWSCRMEEQNRWGENVKSMPKTQKSEIEE